MNQPVAEVVATGGPHDKEDRVLVELQAELPPIGTKLYAESTDPELLAELQKARKLLGQAVAALNPRNKLAEEIREFIIYSKMKP